MSVWLRVRERVNCCCPCLAVRTSVLSAAIPCSFCARYIKNAFRILARNLVTGDFGCCSLNLSFGQQWLILTLSSPKFTTDHRPIIPCQHDTWQSGAGYLLYTLRHSRNNKSQFGHKYNDIILWIPEIHYFWSCALTGSNKIVRSGFRNRI